MTKKKCDFYASKHGDIWINNKVKSSTISNNTLKIFKCPKMKNTIALKHLFIHYNLLHLYSYSDESYLHNVDFPRSRNQAAINTKSLLHYIIF